jgi:hypothetical protein
LTVQKVEETALQHGPGNIEWILKKIELEKKR